VQQQDIFVESRSGIGILTMFAMIMASQSKLQHLNGLF